MPSPKVLVTGGLGNLGSWITRHLAGAGFEVHVLTRKERFALEDTDYRVIECDITDRDALAAKLDGIPYDHCVHCASFNEGFLPGYAEKALMINALGTRNLLEVLAPRALRHFVYFSTFHVYGVGSGNVTEDTPAVPRHDYATTHLFAEIYVRQFGLTHGLPHTILRLTNSYGAPSSVLVEKWYLVLNDLVKMAFEKGAIILKGNGRATRDFIHMGDVAAVVEKLLRAEPANDTFNLASGRTHSMLDIAAFVRDGYRSRYGKEIPLEINEQDTSCPQPVTVRNDKLRSRIPFTAEDRFADEIQKTFALLEAAQGKTVK